MLWKLKDAYPWAQKSKVFMTKDPKLPLIHYLRVAKLVYCARCNNEELIIVMLCGVMVS